MSALDYIVNLAAAPNPVQNFAIQAMMSLSENVHLWTRADAILESSQSSPNSKFFALQLMEDCIKFRWKSLSAEERVSVKSYLVTKVIAASSDEHFVTSKDGSVFVNKLNITLIAVLKQEWPHNWPTFIGDLVGSSRSSEILCENNMKILKLLSEEVFDFSKEEMTTDKVKTMKESLNSEFSSIYHLCEFILEHSSRPSLLRTTLQTLQRFLTWIPVGFIFQTSLISTLTNKFFANPAYRNDALECLTEIGTLTDLSPQYNCLFQNMFLMFMGQLSAIFKPDTDLTPIYLQGRPEDHQFIHRFTLFLTGFLRNHLAVLETPEYLPTLNAALMYLVRVSEVPYIEIFKICLEYWHAFSQELYESDTGGGGGGGSVLNLGGGGQRPAGTGPLVPPSLRGGDDDDDGQDLSGTGASESMYGGGMSAMGGGGGRGPAHPSSSGMMGGMMGGLRGMSHAPGRKEYYSGVMSGVRQVMISRMAKPEEVIVVADEHGEATREIMKDTDVIAQYKTMRECLVYLTHLNGEDTEMIMLEKLRVQMDLAEMALVQTPRQDQNWSWNELNTLCWAIGSISGAMNEEDEKRFLVTVIKDLLRLCEIKSGKSNKAIVAACIMYVVGQYPRFLKAHWKFLKTVVNKLFEFMHESHHGVQDMACDTFLKIAQKCKRKFVTLQTGERVPFICELVESLQTIISDLKPHQVQSFYESVGCMLSDRGQQVTIDRPAVLGKLMEYPNLTWRRIMDNATMTVETLVHPDTVAEVVKILKSNSRVCNSVGSLFIHQLNVIFLDMLNVYKVYSERVSSAVAQGGERATKLTEVKKLCTAKKEVLRLLASFVEKSGEPECGAAAVAAGFLPPVLDPILGDYHRGVPGARDPEVLLLFTVVVEKLKGHAIDHVPRILEAVFECTLMMINRNYEDFPEHRSMFYGFLKAVNSHCFPALFRIPAEHQKLVVQAVVWAFKHFDRNIAETGLDILLELLNNVAQTPEVAQGFYSQFLLTLIQDVLANMTDRLHKSGFKQQVTLLRHMFHLVHQGHVTVPLFDPALLAANPNLSNAAFLHEHVSVLLLQSFPNLTRPQVKVFLDGLFNVQMDLQTCKQHVRDFLIQMREFSEGGADNAGLYAEEQEADARRQREEAMARSRAVPGLLKPSEMGEMDEDL